MLDSTSCNINCACVRTRVAPSVPPEEVLYTKKGVQKIKRKADVIITVDRRTACVRTRFKRANVYIHIHIWIT